MIEWKFTEIRTVSVAIAGLSLFPLTLIYERIQRFSDSAEGHYLKTPPLSLPVSLYLASLILDLSPILTVLIETQSHYLLRAIVSLLFTCLLIGLRCRLKDIDTKGLSTALAPAGKIDLPHFCICYGAFSIMCIAILPDVLLPAVAPSILNVLLIGNLLSGILCLFATLAFADDESKILRLPKKKLRRNLCEFKREITISLDNGISDPSLRKRLENCKKSIDKALEKIEKLPTEKAHSINDLRRLSDLIRKIDAVSNEFAQVKESQPDLQVS